MTLSNSIHRSDRRRGFALLEALAALALTAAFASLALPFAGRMVEQWWRGTAAIEDADAWMQATTRLSAELAQAIPLPRSGQNGLSFRASRNGVTFIRPGRPGSEAGGLLISAYMIEHTRSGDALVNYSARFSPSLLDADPRSFGAATAVLSGAFRLAFVAIDADGRRSDNWIDRKDLPPQIELTVDRIAGDAAPVAIRLPIVAQAPRTTSAPRTNAQ